MIDTNYSIESLRILLNEDCLLARYYSLIPHKQKLIDGLTRLGA